MATLSPPTSCSNVAVTPNLIDMGSAIDYRNPPRDRECTPLYAAPEVLENREATPRSDLASVGYVLIELLSGTNTVCTENEDARPFAGQTGIAGSD